MPLLLKTVVELWWRYQELHEQATDPRVNPSGEGACLDWQRIVSEEALKSATEMVINGQFDISYN
jgi:hypothetical protein